MRIAYVVPTHPFDPTEPFVVNEMVEVQEAGHEIVVAALRPAPAETVQHGTYGRLRPTLILPPALCDWRVLALALGTLLRHPWRVLATLGSAHRAAGWNPYAHTRLLAIAPKALANVRRFRRARVDHIHVHFANERADCAAITSAVSGIPFSFTAHAFDIYPTVLARRNETLPWKLSRAAHAFAVSEFGAALLRSRLPADSPTPVSVAYVGIPTDLFRVEVPPPREEGLLLLCVARFLEKKGIDTLLEACVLLRARGLAFRLRLYGDGPLRAAMVEQIARAGLHDHVILAAPVPQEEVARQMKAHHVFVMPCRQDRTGDMDGIPTVFMEALASGRPVISCALSGIPELVRDGETGLLVPPDDPAALADAIERLARDEAESVRLGQQGRVLVECQHDQRRNARRFLALLLGPVPAGIDAGQVTGPGTAECRPARRQG